MAWGTVEDGQWQLASETLSESRAEEEAMSFRAYLDQIHPVIKGDSEEAKKGNQENQ